MPKIGEIFKVNYVKFIWQACSGCGKERGVKIVKGKPIYSRCCKCSNISTGVGRQYDKCIGWKGGRLKNAMGYIQILLKRNDFFYPMVTKMGYVLEHRLVMAKSLGRCLHMWELVHHENGIKDDNRIENLQLVSIDKHNQMTILENRINQLAAEVKEQAQLIKLLQWQIKELNKTGARVE